MRAVNLIPADSRGRSSSGPSTGMQVPVYVLLGFLAAAVALVTVYVLTNNSISSKHRPAFTASRRRSPRSRPRPAVSASSRSFPQLAQTRISTVRLDRLGAVRLAHRAGEPRRRWSRPTPRFSRSSARSCPAPAAGGGGAAARCSVGHHRARVRADRLHHQPGRRRPPDVAPASDQRRHPRLVQQLAGDELRRSELRVGGSSNSNCRDAPGPRPRST